MYTGWLNMPGQQHYGRELCESTAKNDKTKLISKQPASKMWRTRTALFLLSCVFLSFNVTMHMTTNKGTKCTGRSSLSNKWIWYLSLTHTHLSALNWNNRRIQSWTSSSSSKLIWLTLQIKIKHTLKWWCVTENERKCGGRGAGWLADEASSVCLCGVEHFKTCSNVYRNSPYCLHGCT